MLRQNFDPKRAYRVVAYLRMSSKGQNPRSPDQQLDEIKRTLKRLGFNWTIVKVYRDDAISGRRVKNRPSFKAMKSDLGSGEIDADLILVDTFERFFRGKDSDFHRREFELMGKLILAADSNFTDPTSPAGRALSMVESIRGEEENRVKAHNVLRGKRDAVSRGFWPGGPIPYGYRLEPVIVSDSQGSRHVGNRLVPDPHQRKLIEEIFRLADFGWAGSRIRKHLVKNFVFDDVIPSADSR